MRSKPRRVPCEKRREEEPPWLVLRHHLLASGDAYSCEIVMTCLLSCEAAHSTVPRSPQLTRSLPPFLLPLSLCILNLPDSSPVWRRDALVFGGVSVRPRLPPCLRALILAEVHSVCPTIGSVATSAIQLFYLSSSYLPLTLTCLLAASERGNYCIRPVPLIHPI